MNDEAKPDRECGSCYMCCMVYDIKALEKPAMIRCEHSTEHGCDIYGDPSRPHSCREFECLWITGEMPEPYRPDKVHIVCRTKNYGDLTVIHITEEFPRAAESPTARKIVSAIRGSGYGVILVEDSVGQGVIAPAGLSPEEEKAYLEEFFAAAKRPGMEQKITTVKMDERFGA